METASAGVKRREQCRDANICASFVVRNESVRRTAEATVLHVDGAPETSLRSERLGGSRAARHKIERYHRPTTTPATRGGVAKRYRQVRFVPPAGIEPATLV